MTWQPPRAGSGSRGGWRQRTGVYSSAWARDARQRGRKHSWRGKAATDMTRLLSDLTHASRGLAGEAPHRTKNTCSGALLEDPQEIWSYHRGHPKTHHWEEGTLHHPTASPLNGVLPPQPSISPTPGSQDPILGPERSPADPLLRAAEVLSQALYSYLYRAVINSQRLAAATRGGRFCPPATLQRQGLICLKHTPQPFHGDTSQFHGAHAALMGNAKKRFIYGSAFQSLPPSLSTLTGRSGEPPSPSNLQWGQSLSWGGTGWSWIKVPVPPSPMSQSPPAPSS